MHSPRYLWSLERLAADGGGDLDPDTPVSTGSWDTACLATGAGLAVVDELRSRGTGLGFVAVRPPGHHARPGIGMGFCLLNNIAVAAAALADAGDRVLVVDWDVHHGNGTQEAFWDDPRVMYASVHQSPWYPGTGQATESGGSGAPGTTVNVPLPAGATGEMYRRAIDEVVADAAATFDPTWVLVSAGFDGHRDDPLAQHELSAADYGELASRVGALAPGDGRLVLFLEGGYDHAALRHSVAATIGRLTGVFEIDEPPTFGGPGAEMIDVARDVRARWVRDPCRTGRGPTGARRDRHPPHRRRGGRLRQRSTRRSSGPSPSPSLPPPGSRPCTRSASSKSSARNAPSGRTTARMSSATSARHGASRSTAWRSPTRVRRTRRTARRRHSRHRGVCDADLIVVGERASNRGTSRALGSTSRQVLERADRPVLVVPVDERR